MIDRILLLPIVIPLSGGILVLAITKRWRGIKETLALVVTLANLFLAFILFRANLNYFLPWLGFGIDFSLKIYHFSAFIIIASAAFAFLIALYSCVFMRGKENLNQFYSYLLITLAFTNGAVLADNLVLMLFFWEGLLLALFGMIAIASRAAFKTAIKAFIIVGICDLCMMLGIALTAHLSGTLAISKISLPLNTLGSLAFVLLMIGAISKAGAMPFHSWIPDAALDAPLPFMAFLPAALEKLLGIYFLARISLDMFTLNAGSWISPMLMVIGSLTIILAVMMALIQKDYKKLLSYHAISQVGYMILGIGTTVSAGIVGGLFHMINHAMYKSCLFLTSGSVARETGTANLERLGGIGKKMPFTFICFIITAASISGVPPFNGFFSKELVYEAALERGWIFYIAAVGGSFFTAASFLKLGHAVFLGKLNAEHKNVKETSFFMLAPMVIIACGCILFGIWNYLPLDNLIQPIAGERLNGHSFSGAPTNIKIVIVTLIVLIAAFLNHLFGVKMKGSGLKAVDHIRYAPILKAIYDRAEKGYFDPYEIGLKAVKLISKISWRIDRWIDYIYSNFIVALAYALTNRVRSLHNGNYARYLAWALSGVLLVTLFLMSSP
ncbi:MAG: proton-conducting transporter membrane subunit [Candidatus Omnitrophica bacterium]|nr:proton-conducting transporter membrane subunit [Candidatus Omnitrophota bacterium]MDD5593085.1 proton-conducting transporter membrane subunit [Candidatus Omnitrophota bacterium]